ncbi:Uncharacterised protein [Lysinibacillus capsici]|uniref:Uncharacterized protein n=1 Tax=Lysinibacillus capsici TaxID=2115968 RepID=A0A2X1A639_9BACI|nr:hypothetical protein [Lysinibacillus capsici]SPU40628.1 Uncharacterised protein [Lysinibacillus capsici]
MNRNLSISTFIALLPFPLQKDIQADLMNAGILGEELEIALSSRLCDLEDVINIEPYKEILSSKLTGFVIGELTMVSPLNPKENPLEVFKVSLDHRVKIQHFEVLKERHACRIGKPIFDRELIVVINLYQGKKPLLHFNSEDNTVIHPVETTLSTLMDLVTESTTFGIQFNDSYQEVDILSNGKFGEVLKIDGQNEILILFELKSNQDITNRVLNVLEKVFKS